MFSDTARDMPPGRRLSNQSLGSGIGAIPTKGSAFTNLFKHNTSNLSEAPASVFRDVAAANRVGQQTIKLGKNIRSDRDILEEEVFRPTKHRPSVSDGDQLPSESVTDDMQETPAHAELTVKQIIKYKHNIQTENVRRQHREKLAELARQQRKKEDFFQFDPSANMEELQQQQVDQDDATMQVVPTEAQETKAPHKVSAKSKEEEEILNDENIFQPRKYRDRARPRHKGLPGRSGATDLHGRYPRDLRSTRNEPRNTYCKACGKAINAENALIKPDSTQTCTATSTRPLEPYGNDQSVVASSGAVDDWFDSAPSAATSRQSTPRTFDDATPLPIGASTFRRNLFEPIKDSNMDADVKTNRLTSPRFSESGIFARSPDTRPRRPSSSRSLTSPASKKRQLGAAVTSPPATKTIAQASPPRSRRPSSSAAAMFTATERKTSGWSVREPSPDDSN